MTYVVGAVPEIQIFKYISNVTCIFISMGLYKKDVTPVR